MAKRRHANTNTLPLSSVVENKRNDAPIVLLLISLSWSMMLKEIKDIRCK